MLISGSNADFAVPDRDHGKLLGGDFKKPFPNGLNSFFERKSVMDSDGLAGSIVILALILLKTFLAVCENAAAEIGDSKLRTFENGNAAEKRLYSMLKKPAALERTFAFGKGALSSMICVMSELIFIGMLSGQLGEAMPAAAAYILSAVIILLADALVILAVCCGLPKRFVTKKSAADTAVRCSAALRFFTVLLTPLSMLSSSIISVFDGTPEDADEVTEEEILMMVDAGNVEESQREMISNIFEFDDKDVSDVMTHRTDIVAVETTAGISEIVNASISSGFSRIPVYEDSIDHIVGVISVKDLLCMIGSDAAQSTVAKDLMRDVFYVPESMHCSELFKLLSQKKTVMAIVVDEYGGTAGMVTMEDLVETIVGDIRDEYDNEEEDIKQISDDTYTISGNASPEDVFRELGLEPPEDNDSDTMSGFVTSLLGHIPEESEHASVRYQNVLFTVLVTEDMWISKLKAEIIHDDRSDGDDRDNENNENEKEKINEDEH